MVGDVLGGVLLDLDLGDVVDLVVDVIADMLDHGGGVDEVLDWDGGSGGEVVGHGGDSLHLHRLHLDRLDGSVGQGGCSNEGGVDDLDSLADGVNKSLKRKLDIISPDLQDTNPSWSRSSENPSRARDL